MLQIQTVPEPSTWALMAFGLGTLGVVGRRRQRR
ncbi:MAG: PEPxxWA-CTERM sorting domain-containing protein [Gemmatimonadaceae bacterium]|nr:PEPxxWA-CTERM sorting domain-containing protein [Gemmatimonadaceae bacterium]